MARRQSGALRTVRFVLRKVATAGIAVVAMAVALVTWDQYNAGPWTRNGRVRVHVASVAPQISGQIRELRIADNQFVRKGDILYVIEPFDFEAALRAHKATLQQKIADLNVKQLQSERRSRLSDLSASVEQKQVYEGSALQAKAAVDAAQEQVSQAEINLQRTAVRSPVNGIVTNLLLREGDYAHQGATNVSIIDADSYWVDGYFEETKLARLCVGDRAEAKLMGYSAPIIGHIATVTRGISVSNAAASTQGLPNVDPVYTWVRLAQRVPVRIAIDKVPPGVPLVSGLTATVTIRDGKDETLLQRVHTELVASFFGLIGEASARSGCIPGLPSP
ncbi:MAG: HlyD family secretion protein [Steroidobacteraceae bacterium]